LLAYDAEVELVSLQDSRWVPYQSFHTGYKKMIMEPDELLARVRLPRPWPDLHHYYRKVGTRKAQAISKVCLAATARVYEGTVDHVRLALGSIAPVPLRCVKTENALRGARLDESIIEKARVELAREIVPIDDIRSTKSYRLRVSLNLLDDFLRQLAVDGIVRSDE
jgi:CO/xanthine dehydrogenase FAD-binding subunit